VPATSFFGGEFFSGEFFNAVTVVVEPPVGRSAPYGVPSAMVRPRTRRDVERDRERFGIATKVVREVAKTQQRNPELDRLQRMEMLQAELAANALEWDSRYWDLLEQEVKIRTDLENRRRIAAQLEEELVIFTLIASQL